MHICCETFVEEVVRENVYGLLEEMREDEARVSSAEETLTVATLESERAREEHDQALKVATQKLQAYSAGKLARLQLEAMYTSMTMLRPTLLRHLRRHSYIIGVAIQRGLVDAAITLQAVLRRSKDKLKERERMASSMLQAAVRMQRAGTKYGSRRLGGLRMQAVSRRTIRRSLYFEEREEARKNRLLMKTPAAIAISKVSPRLLRSWQAVSEPMQDMPFHAPTAINQSTSKTRAKKLIEVIEKTEADLEEQRLEHFRLRKQTEIEVEAQRLVNLRLRELASNTLSPIQLRNLPTLSESRLQDTQHFGAVDQGEVSDSSEASFESSDGSVVLNEEMDRLEQKLQVCLALWE